MAPPTKPKIPLRAKWVALSGALTLAYTAWGFAGVIGWSLHIMLAGGLLTFLLAVAPMPSRRAARSEMRDSGNSISRNSQAVSRIPHLLKVPAFYFATAFLLYLAIAALNPAWRIASDHRGWWLEPMEPPLSAGLTGLMEGSNDGDHSSHSDRVMNPRATKHWLPTSVQSPYEPMNAWRIFNMHLAAFSLALGLFLGLSSRRALLFVLWAFVFSAAAMAAVAILQKYTGSESVLWTYKSENQNFWGSFFYRNQGAAYLNWGIVIAGVLYFYHARRSREEARSGGPHFLAFCCIGLLVVSVALALSRGGILFAAILVLVFFCLVLIDYVVSVVAASGLQPPVSVWLPIAAILTLLLSIGIFQAYRAIDFDAIEERFGDIGATIDDADSDARAISSRLTWEMAQDQLWTGWGAGSFRYAFPMYQQKIPEFFHGYYHKRKQEWVGRRFYRYAHNDILQFLAEYGIVGCSLLVLAIMSFFYSALRLRLSSLWLALGLLAAASHAFLDFIFHSPAYWVALIGGLALVARLTQLEAKRESL